MTTSKGGRPRKLSPNDNDIKSERKFAEDLKVYTKDLEPIATNPPDELHGAGRYMWTYLIPEIKKMDQLKKVDRSTMESYCEQFTIYREAMKDVNEHGISTAIYKTVMNQVTGEKTTDFVGYKKNPAVSIISDATRNMKALASELGFTPQSRAAIMQIMKDTDKETDETLADILNGGDNL